MSQVNLSTEERIQLIQRPLWIPYPETDLVHEQLHDMMGYSLGADPPGMTLYGYKGAGKTALLKEFRASYPVDLEINPDADTIPVLYFIMPPTLKEEQLYEAILRGIGTSVNVQRGKSLRNHVLQNLLRVRARMVIADEIHNLLGGSDKQIIRLIKVLTTLSDELKEAQLKTFNVQIQGATAWVLVGTPKAITVLSVAPEFHRRFPPRRFPIWESGEDKNMRLFLAELEVTLKLSQPSKLSTTKFSEIIFAKCGGYRHNIIDLIQKCAIFALRTKREKIDEVLIGEYIEKYQWIPPATLDQAE